MYRFTMYEAEDSLRAWNGPSILMVFIFTDFYQTVGNEIVHLRF